jgi:hypothetical protein
MLIDPVLKMFWILIAAILGTNAAWLIYMSSVEDEIDALYKLMKCQPLSPSDKKNLNKIARRKK